MKKILVLVMSFFLVNSFSYASFPVVNNDAQSELVVSNENEINVLAPPAEFHFGGFILGLLLGLIGVGLAYIFSNNADFRRNAWYGFGTWLILWLLLIMPAM